jgi:hypothetical protein
MLIKRLSSTLLPIIAIVFLAGCGGDEATVVNLSQGVITTRGATVPGQTTTIRDVDGFGVTIPPEALPDGVKSIELVLGRVTNPRNLDVECAIGTVRFIEVENVRRSISDTERRNIQYNLREDSFEFASSVTVSFPYGPEEMAQIDDPPTEAGMDTFDPEIENWVPVPDDDISIVPESRTLLVNTRHFSQFVIVDRPECIRPVIHSVQPAYATTGAVISVFGEHFRSAPDEPRIVFSNGAETAVISSSDFSLEFIVPQDAVTGPIRVKVGPFISNAVEFIVTGGAASPVINSIAPASGPPCTIVTLQGVNLAGENNNPPGQTTWINFGTYTIAPILAASSTVTFKAPCETSPGVYDVSASRDGQTSNAVSFIVTAGEGPGSSVTGTVRDVAGVPLPGVTVTTLGTDLDLLVTTTNGEGKYELDGVLEGQRVIAFSHPGRTTKSRLTVIEESVPLYLDAILAPWTGMIPEDRPVITMTPPELDDELGIANVSGNILDLDSTQAVVTNNGNDSILSVSSPFEQSVILNVGENLIDVRATNAFGTARSPVFNVEYSPGSNFIFRATLSWSQNDTDLDIHAWYEDSEHCSYRSDTDNLRLDLDNTSGFGPENITTASDPPDGSYFIAVNYYEGSSPVEAVVSVTINPGTSFEEVRSFGPYLLTEENFDSSYPVTADTGSWWRPVDISVFNGVASFLSVDAQNGLPEFGR